MRKNDKQPKYSWQYIFDEVKKFNGQTVTIELKSKKRYSQPETPNAVKGYCYMYARYEASTDAIVIWAYTKNVIESHDIHDGSWGVESEQEMVQGKRNRMGVWIEPLKSSFDNRAYSTT